MLCWSDVYYNHFKRGLEKILVQSLEINRGTCPLLGKQVIIPRSI